MAFLMMRKLFYSQLFVTPKYPDQDLSGQTIIVTGANVGLGFEAARHFVRLNAKKVIIAVRSTAKGEAAKKSIAESTGRGDAIEVWLLDLGNYASVKAFAKRASELPRLDAVVENAGVATDRFTTAEDNESTITINVISTFLLALLLLPKLRDTASKFNIQPHLTIVTSEVHYLTTIPEKSNPSILEALRDEKKSKMGERYPVSKLLEVLYVRRLAPEISKSHGSSVILNMLNPGLCHSELTQGKSSESVSVETPFFMKVMKFLLARTTEVGSRTLVASAIAGPESHGQYMSDGVVEPVAPWVESKEGQKTADRVWEEINQALERIEPGITKNI